MALTNGKFILLVARGRFELPSAGPKPAMLVRYIRQSFFLFYRAKQFSGLHSLSIILSFILILTSNYTLEYENLQKEELYDFLCGQRDSQEKVLRLLFKE